MPDAWQRATAQRLNVFDTKVEKDHCERAVKELMAVLIVNFGFDATELYDLADETIKTVRG